MSIYNCWCILNLQCLKSVISVISVSYNILMPLNIELGIKICDFLKPGSIFRCEILNSYKILNPGLKIVWLRYHFLLLLERGVYIYYGGEILNPTHMFYSLWIGGGGFKIFLPQNIKYIKRSFLTTVSQERELCVDCIYINVSPRPHTGIFLPY